MKRPLLTIATIALVGLGLLSGDPIPAQAGRVGGPVTTLLFIPAYECVYVDAPFTVGEPAIVTIAGDGNSDLDLYLYDADGHVSPATGYGDSKFATMQVYRTGFFVSQVTNRGPWDATVVMTTN